MAEDKEVKRSSSEFSRRFPGKSKSGQKEEKSEKDQGKGGKGGSTPRQKKGSGSDTARSSRSTDSRQSRTSSRSSRKSNTPRSEGGETPREGRSKQKDHFKEELKRLKESLDKEASKIEAPEKKEYSPYVFNALEPYYDVTAAEYLSEMPNETRHGYANRQTATGLCDPWVDHRMDVEMLPKVESKPVEEGDEKKKKKDDKDRPPKEGSTHLPKYPCVTVPTGDYTTRQLYFDEVPMLREELREKYSQNAEKKIDDDYKRTKQDFYRMELDKMDEYHPVSRPNMRKAYFAYLQNTTGSKKAVKECVKGVEKKEKEKKKKEEEEERKRKEEEKKKKQQSRQQSRRTSQASRQTTQAAA